MQVKWYEIGELTPHEDNPRMIDTFKFNTLVDSIQEFPKMLEARPIIIDMQNNIICGNMRYLACKEIGMESVPAKQVDLPEEKIKELMIKDNLAYGDWDYSALEKDWDIGLFDKWLGNQQIDYSALDYEDLSDKVDAMHDGVKKAIQIKLDPVDFDLAKELEHNCRTNNIYIGGLFLGTMKRNKGEWNE